MESDEGSAGDIFGGGDLDFGVSVESWRGVWVVSSLPPLFYFYCYSAQVRHLLCVNFTFYFLFLLI